MKTVSRSKFLLCCRPFVDIAAGETSAKSGTGFLAGLREPVPCPPKRTLSRVIRAVLFEVVLSKTVGDRKRLRSSKSSDSLSQEGSASSSYASDENKTEFLEDQDTKPNSTEVSPSSVQEQKRYWSKKSSVNPNDVAKESINCGVFIFVISLTVTVMWGKLWAIMFTSLWIYFLPLPRRIAGIRRPETVKPSYYKKKVMMEERTKRRAEKAENLQLIVYANKKLYF